MDDFNNEFKDINYDELVNLVKQKSPEKKVKAKDSFTTTQTTIENQYAEIIVLLNKGVTTKSLKDIELKLNALNENLVSLLFSNANTNDEDLKSNNRAFYDSYKNEVTYIIQIVEKERAKAAFTILYLDLQKIISDPKASDPKKLIECVDVIIVNLSILKIKFEDQLRNPQVDDTIKSMNLRIKEFIVSMKEQLSDAEINQARIYTSVEKNLQALDKRYASIDMEEIDRNNLDDLSAEVTSLKNCLDEMNKNNIDCFREPFLKMIVQTNLIRYLNFRYSMISNIEDEIYQAEENIGFDTPDFCNESAPELDDDFDIQDNSASNSPSTPKSKLKY